MAQQIEAPARIKRGLPVIAVGRVYPAEPDVGAGPCADLDDICFPDGRSIPTHWWQDLTQADLDACHDALLNGGNDWRADYGDYLYEQRRDRQLEAMAARDGVA
jgi:hypothetical protein